MAETPAGIVWPEGKRFAFAIFDDTDLATLEELRNVYAFLLDNGVCATKSVWMYDSPDSNRRGVTCEHPDYTEWLLRIREQGVEIAYHNAADGSSERDRTVAALQRFRELFGEMPTAYACHAECAENIYWGSARLSSLLYRGLYNALTGFKQAQRFQGHLESSKWFWGDVCKQHIRFVRNFTFSNVNTLAMCPFMPYHDPLRPFVNLWFASTDGPDVQSFSARLSEQNQDSLEEQGGACIMYTHTGKGFCRGGKLDPEFARLIERLSRKDGWFVPVSELLAFLETTRGAHFITDIERKRLEGAWLWDRVRLRRAGR